MLRRYLTMQFWRGWATMGIFPPFKRMMRGDGMHPLGIIGPSYCETSSRQEPKRKRFLGKVSSGHNRPSYQVAKVLIITLHRNDLVVWCCKSIPELQRQCRERLFPILCYYWQYAERRATWLSGGGGEARWRTWEPFWHRNVSQASTNNIYASCFT